MDDHLAEDIEGVELRIDDKHQEKVNELKKCYVGSQKQKTAPYLKKVSDRMVSNSHRQKTTSH